MVCVTSVWIAQILTTVANANTHQIRRILVTGLKNRNETEGRGMKICRICLTGPRLNFASIAQKRRPGDAPILESRHSLKVIM